MGDISELKKVREEKEKKLQAKKAKLAAKGVM